MTEIVYKSAKPGYKKWDRTCGLTSGKKATKRNVLGSELKVWTKVGFKRHPFTAARPISEQTDSFLTANFTEVKWEKKRRNISGPNKICNILIISIHYVCVCTKWS